MTINDHTPINAESPSVAADADDVSPTAENDQTVGGVAEARAVLGQAASLLDAEWQRLRQTMGDAPLPAPVRSVASRLDGLAGVVRREAMSTTSTLGREVNDRFGGIRARATELGPTLVASGRRAADRVGLPLPGFLIPDTATGIETSPGADDPSADDAPGDPAGGDA
jgi:hypothetical protein